MIFIDVSVSFILRLARLPDMGKSPQSWFLSFLRAKEYQVT